MAYEVTMPRDGDVEIMVDGTPLSVRGGVMLAAALLEAGIVGLRHSPRADAPRGAFCFMGVCQECVVEIDGATAQACLVPAAAGMQVRLIGPQAA